MLGVAAGEGAAALEGCSPAAGGPPDVIAATGRLAGGRCSTTSAASSRPRPPAPSDAGSYRWPNFLKADNLLNIANQIAVIAIIAIGMTMVIITGGIDLSVGSLIALSAVLATLLIRDAAGGESAAPAGMVAVLPGGDRRCAALVGAVLRADGHALRASRRSSSRSAMMLVASGAGVHPGRRAVDLPGARLVHLARPRRRPVRHPERRRADAACSTPLAHVLMTPHGARPLRLRRRRQRRGGPALRRAGPAGAAAGLRRSAARWPAWAGWSWRRSSRAASPTYGQMYELYVIAAVVVGGTSALRGGEGKVLGTLIGAFIIAVIQNGMNLTGVESYTQKIVLGLVILGAVLLDRLNKCAGSFPWFDRRTHKKSQPVPAGG